MKMFSYISRIDRIVRSSAITVFALAMCVAVSQADEKEIQQTVEVTGTGSSLSEARQDAIRQAVQETTDQLIVADRQVTDDDVVRDTVLSTMNGFITKFEVVSQSKGNGSVELKAKITVSQSGIKNFIGASNKKTGTSIDGQSLGAEIARREAASDSFAQILANALRRTPLDSYEVKVEQVKIDDADPSKLLVDISMGWNPTFLSSFRKLVSTLADQRTSKQKFEVCLEDESDCYYLPQANYFSRIGLKPGEGSGGITLYLVNNSGEIVATPAYGLDGGSGLQILKMSQDNGGAIHLLPGQKSAELKVDLNNIDAASLSRVDAYPFLIGTGSALTTAEMSYSPSGYGANFAVFDIVSPGYECLMNMPITGVSNGGYQVVRCEQ